MQRVSILPVRTSRALSCGSWSFFQRYPPLLEIDGTVLNQKKLLGFKTNEFSCEDVC